MSAEEQEVIRALYRQYWQYMIEKNLAGLRAILAEDYSLTHMTGLRQSREEFLAQLQSGTFNYYAAQHDGIEVTIRGEKSAAMIGKSRVLAAVYGGGKHSWKLRGDFTLRKEHGSWKLTGSRASTY